MRTQVPTHDDSCANGHGVFLHPKNDKRYSLLKLFKCRWNCPAQALYRITRVAKEALKYETNLAYEWLDSGAQQSLQRRAYRRGVGYMSFSVADRNDKFVIAGPKAMPQVRAGEAVKTLQSLLPNLVELNITRLSTAEMWRPEAPGFERIGYTKSNDTRQVELDLESAGFINGMITVDRPLEYHIEALQSRLADTINL